MAFFSFFFSFFHAQIEIVFLRTIDTQSNTGTPLFCLALNTKPFWIVPVIPGENIFQPGIFILRIFFFKIVTKILKQKFPLNSFVLYVLNKKKISVHCKGLQLIFIIAEFHLSPDFGSLEHPKSKVEITRTYSPIIMTYF